MKPITVSAAVWYEVTYIIDPPITLTPVEDGGWVSAEVPELNIVLMGRPDEDMKELLAQDIDFLWRVYACEQDARLDADARALKQHILARITRKLSGA